VDPVEAVYEEDFSEYNEDPRDTQGKIDALLGR